MQPKTEGWTIVITGNWNVNIFQPKWMNEFLNLEDVVATFFVGPQGYEVRISSNKLLLVPRPDRLIIGTTSLDDRDLEYMQNIAEKILGVLIHTPVNGIGINFSFEDLSPTKPLRNEFNLSDDSLLFQQMGQSPTVTEIKRSFPRGSFILNHILTYSQDKIDLLLNYHSDVTTAKAVLSFLNDNNVINLRDQTNKLIDSMYNTEE